MAVASQWHQQLSQHRCGTVWHNHWLIPVFFAVVFVHACFPLEVSVGKYNQIKAINGSDVLLQCTFSSCIGFEDVSFFWYYSFNNTGKLEELMKGTLKDKKSTPNIFNNPDKNDRMLRVQLIPSNDTKDYNLSLLLKYADFEDSGRYICKVINKKEKGASHNATVYLTVVHKFEAVDNTLTRIIVAVVGGVIGLLILILIIKKTITFIMKRNSDKKKDCLVSSSVNDNTDNASKPESKDKPKE
ncbi:sodium channel regulatory subunit beta-4 isoform 1-T3 [Rhinophrynus dorsalis]